MLVSNDFYYKSILCEILLQELSTFLRTINYCKYIYIYNFPQNRPRTYRWTPLLSLVLDYIGVQRHVPADLPLEITRNPLCRSLSWPQRRSGRVRKLFPSQDSIANSPACGKLLYRLSYLEQFSLWQVAIPTELSRTVQRVASCYTDWAISNHEDMQVVFRK
jgi:hypothetical protein